MTFYVVRDYNILSVVGHIAMEPTATVSQSNSSDYFEDEDSQFLEALGAAILPGDLPKEHDSEEDSQELDLPPPSQPCLKRRHSQISFDEQKDDSELNVNENETYGASRFGGFGEYMRRKRAKLQIQNAELEQQSVTDDRAKSQIFKGIAIYVSLLYTKWIN